MNKIVDLRDYRLRNLGQKAFAAWEKRFRMNFHRNVCIEDLPDAVLYLLARPDEESIDALNELIMGALDLGEASFFSELPAEKQLKVMDIQLRLTDGFRFEVMRRLGWIRMNPEMERGFLLEQVVCGESSGELVDVAEPVLNETHPQFDEYRKQTGRDRTVFIRRLFPDALRTFAPERG